jgi:thioredoxin reductase
MTTLDWLIIGGGIHGVHIAARLIGDAEVSTDRLRIVDPGDRLLARWRNCTEATGMSHLRSPSVHHLGIEHGALQRFAGKRKRQRSGLFAPPFDRPSLALFNAHCEQVAETFGLADLHIRDRALSCSIDCDHVGVRLSSGRDLEARNLVLAIGASEQPEWPEWAPRADQRVHHVFDPEFDGWPSSPETIVVVGGGISAGHVVLRLLSEGHQVHLVSRHALRQHQFDSDPSWLGLKYSAGFSREQDLAQRRAVITDVRHKGSVSPDIGRSLRRAIARKQLLWHEDEVTCLDTQDDRFELTLDTETILSPDRLLLATGFAACRPGGSMIDELIASASLPCAGCGYPIVDTALRWHPRVYVSGPLAELELGPVSRNIAGARWAADRIVGAARTPPPSAAG